MKRWAVRITRPDLSLVWWTPSTGLSPDVQMAHLYTRKILAEKKVKDYEDIMDKGWYIRAEIVEFEVNFVESEK